MARPIVRMFKHLNEGIYVTMQGPSEFKTGGRLITWDRSKTFLPSRCYADHRRCVRHDGPEIHGMDEHAGATWKLCLLPEGSHCDIGMISNIIFQTHKIIKDVDTSNNLKIWAGTVMLFLSLGTTAQRTEKPLCMAIIGWWLPAGPWLRKPAHRYSRRAAMPSMPPVRR